MGRIILLWSVGWVLISLGWESSNNGLSPIFSICKWRLEWWPMLQLARHSSSELSDQTSTSSDFGTEEIVPNFRDIWKVWGRQANGLFERTVSWPILVFFGIYKNVCTTKWFFYCGIKSRWPFGVICRVFFVRDSRDSSSLCLQTMKPRIIFSPKKKNNSFSVLFITFLDRAVWTFDGLGSSPQHKPHSFILGDS